MSGMDLDLVIAQAIDQAISEGRLEAIDGVPGTCHVLVQHILGCPMRRTQGRDDRCGCGNRLVITLHTGESADCQSCVQRPSEH
jgi:hypothetical protein